MANELSAALLARLAQTPDDASTILHAADLANAATVVALVRAALAQAESEPQAAAAWLTAAAIMQPEVADLPDLSAQIAYARARVQLAAGDLPGAEASLRSARSQWAALDDQANLARSSLGLTQVLTAQGRHGEAETTIMAAIFVLEQLGEPARLQRLAAQQNLATLLSYQERHAEALAIQERAHGQLLVLLAAADAESRGELLARCARVEMALALSHTYLDAPAPAVAALTTAIERLSEANALFERGRVRTNLATVLARTGQYAAAREQINLALLDLFGTTEVDAVPERWPPAGAFFLEQAVVELALNLLPEAEAALTRGVTLFRRTNQRYELAQALYYQALLSCQRDDRDPAAALLAEALQLFEQLDNVYWRHRVRLVQTGLALRLGDLIGAQAEATALLASSAVRSEAAPLGWDQGMRVELHLLRISLALAMGDLPAARQAASAAALALDFPSVESTAQILLPHLQQRLLYALGQIEQAAGAATVARRYFVRAIDLLEAQRATLPLEELRTAYLADKSSLYADLVLSLLDALADSPDAVADAFLVVERARARALLERLVGALAEPAPQSAAGATDAAVVAALRQELTWLYNRLLGDEGSRSTGPALNQAIQTREAALQQHALRMDGWLAHAKPVPLQELQAVLRQDQQAIVYYAAGDEVMAFVVDRGHIEVVRALCSLSELQAALADLRFQLGRVEIGGDYVARHRQRLLAGARQALHHLYMLVAAPLAPLLTATHLQIVPYGPLHLLPFHALWDGTDYWQARHTFTYGASASVVVHLRRQPEVASFSTLAALALQDAAIPQAEAEVRAAAAHFQQAQLFFAADADLAGLKQAAAVGDVLHLATHGLFRPDNPFFSALKLADSWVDVRQLYQLPLRARLVVLSACESGAVQIQGNDEPIGLARGFLGAGARQLVVSLWNVHDASAAQLMNRFYANLTTAPTPDPLTALHDAQRAEAQAGLHPYYWAPYVLIG